MEYGGPIANEECLKGDLPALSFYLKVYFQSAVEIILRILEK